jgi:hypothetical protein
VRVAHRQGVGVVEAERHRGLQAARRQQAVQVLDRRAGGIRRLAPQQLAHDGAGVLRVDVDRAARECLRQDAGVAQALAVLCRDAGALQRLPHQLAEHVALREALGADDHRLGGQRRATAEAGQAGQEEAQPGSHPERRPPVVQAGAA